MRKVTTNFMTNHAAGFVAENISLKTMYSASTMAS